MLICDHDEKLHLTTSRRREATAGWSRFWGALLEALVNGGDWARLDLGFRTWLRGVLRPGTSVLLLAVTEAAGAQAVETLSSFGGESASSPLGDDLLGR